jgi:putative ABC transport system permease protein
MNISGISSEALQSLAAHKLRAFLMMIGTVVAVLALTVILAIEKGTQIEVTNRVESFGTRLIKINAGGGKGYTKPLPSVTTLRLEDAEAIRSSLVGWDIVTSVAQRNNVPTKAGDMQSTASVYAVDADWHEAMDWPAEQGEGISGDDVGTLARVCVLGAGLAKSLFGSENPVGRDIDIEKVRFRVKGVLVRHDVSPGGEDENIRAVIPLTTGLRRLYNQDHLSYIRVRIANAGQVAAMAKEIRQLLHERHHIVPPQEDDFSIVTAGEVAEVARSISLTLTRLLTALAGLALLVSGAVMMNILLLGVSQRKSEIGLRRAIGATRRDVFAQFLCESLAVTLLGAAIGALLGWTVSALLPNFTKLKIAVSWEPFALAVACALVIGVLCGVLPAQRAARLNPVDALR